LTIVRRRGHSDALPVIDRGRSGSARRKIQRWSRTAAARKHHCRNKNNKNGHTPSKALHGLSSERPRYWILLPEFGSESKSVALVCYFCRANGEIDGGRVSLWKTGERLTMQAAQAEVPTQGRFHLSAIIVAVY
jgi:hypothetical protein